MCGIGSRAALQWTNLLFWQQQLWHRRHCGQRLAYKCSKSSWVGRKDICPYCNVQQCSIFGCEDSIRVWISDRLRANMFGSLLLLVELYLSEKHVIYILLRHCLMFSRCSGEPHIHAFQFNSSTSLSKVNKQGLLIGKEFPEITDSFSMSDSPQNQFSLVKLAHLPNHCYRYYCPYG